ncbi:MAG: hypothetical protein IKH71_16450, partial [Oscillospiraceae bacterium]|nr:hypothetical protein [Oscillospiraceae bacterium]
MFNSIFQDSELALNTFLMATLSAVAAGFIISLIYLITNKKEGYSQSYVWTIIMLPPIVAIVIATIGNNVASSLSLAGAFITTSTTNSCSGFVGFNGSTLTITNSLYAPTAP